MLTATSDNDSALRERRCIATGAVLPEDALVRYVVSPDGEVVPDLDGKLPGRGIWLSANRAAMEKALAKNAFSKAAKAQVKVAADLPDHVERLLVAKLLADLGMARRAGFAEVGFDSVQRGLDKKIPPVLFFHAADASDDGSRKIRSALYSRDLKGETINLLTRAELSLALGRENVVHAAIRPGALAERLTLNAKRLAGLRGTPTNPKGFVQPKGQNESTL